MKNFRFMIGLAVAATLLHAASAYAQTVTQQPQFVAPGAVLDAGNGPLEFKILTGSAAMFTSQASGVGSTSGSSTSLTLTATAAANPPCVGCVISGTGITAGTTVASFNGTTGIGMSAAMTVAASTAVSWGKACPTPPPTNPAAFVQAGVGGDMPFYTYARICMYGATGPGAQFLSFPIGAH